MVQKISMLDLNAELVLFEADVRRAIDAVLDSQQFINGPQVAELEARMAERLGCAHVIAVSSGTDAILAALMTLGVGSGDEVITTPFTFFATAGCIYRCGAKAVFADIESDTFNIDPADIEKRITPRTKAIMPVHLFGQCADMDAINAIAHRHGLPVIEDAAQAIGASSDGRMAGALGLAGCFSFYPTKNLGGFGEGGMVTTNDAEFADRCRKMRNHGETSRYHHRFVGGNFRLDTMKAAILLAKLAKLDDMTARRVENARRYDERLAGIPGIQTPVVRPKNRSCYHQYSILCEQRDALQSHLAARGIGSGIYYPVPLHLQECFADWKYRPGDYPVAEGSAQRILSLPVHPMLAPEDVARVADAVSELAADAACGGSGRVAAGT